MNNPVPIDYEISAKSGNLSTCDSNDQVVYSVLCNRRWKVYNAAEVWNPQPPTEYVIKNLITRGSINMFYGDPGSKKTYSLMHMGVCVATGHEWVGFETTPSRVLLIDEESGKKRVINRLGEIMRGVVVDEDIPFQFVCLAAFKLDNENDQTLLKELITATGTELVIIDALADIMDGDENCKQDTQPVFNSLKKIAEDTNAAIVVIHHSGKKGDYRGSSAIKGAVDLMIEIRSKDGANTVEFKTKKNRDGEELKFVAAASWVDGKFTLTLQEHGSFTNINISEDYVTHYLRIHGPSEIDKLKAEADICSARAAGDAVYRLAKRGMIKRANPDAGVGKKAIYTLP